MPSNLGAENNSQVPIMEARACAECGAPLPSGVSDVFCPACALRGALDGGRPPGEGTLLRWFQRLVAGKQHGQSHEKPLANEKEEKQSLPMTTVAPAPGELIGDYEILERIGGNMGLVFEARHRRLDKVVALKLVPADSIADPARLARFQREMRVMGQLKHPNLVAADDARAEGEWHLVTMELIDGVDLYQLVRSQGALPVAAACEAARQAAQGLQYAHEHGMIHRDIKPSNLMLTRTGTIKVIDMGLALAREDSTAQLTQTGLVLGTMSYCAPEQFLDASHVDIRADIYSLGCTLYHLLTGKSPYSRRKTVAEIMQAHLHEPFPNLTDALPDAPAGLQAVLARMTAKDREARFSTPGEVVDALEPFLRGADLASLVPAKTQQKPQRASTGKPSPTPHRHPATSQPQQPSALWTRRAALIGLGGAITGGVMLSLNLKRDPVIVLMDTTAKRGIYDLRDKEFGRSNSKELYDLIKSEIKEIPPENINEQSVDLNWNRRNDVRSKRPNLVVIHRSVFYHPRAAALGFLYPDEIKTKFVDKAKIDEELEQFESLYKILGDDVLREFLNDIASSNTRTKFLVYSRGTDPKWLRPEFHLEWIRALEDEYPALKGRVKTMVIEGEQQGTFKNPNTRKDLVKRVREMLGLPAKRDSEEPK